MPTENGRDARFHPHTYLLVKVISRIFLNICEGGFMPPSIKKKKKRFPRFLNPIGFTQNFVTRLERTFLLAVNRYQIWAWEMHLCSHHHARGNSLLNWLTVCMNCHSRSIQSIQNDFLSVCAFPKDKRHSRTAALEPNDSSPAHISRWQ